MTADLSGQNFFLKLDSLKVSSASLPLGDRSVIAEVVLNRLDSSRACLLPTKLCVRRERLQIHAFASLPEPRLPRSPAAPPLRAAQGRWTLLDGAWRALLCLIRSELRCTGSPHGTAGRLSQSPCTLRGPRGTGHGWDGNLLSTGFGVCALPLSPLGEDPALV